MAFVSSSVTSRKLATRRSSAWKSTGPRIRSDFGTARQCVLKGGKLKESFFGGQSHHVIENMRGVGQIRAKGVETNPQRTHNEVAQTARHGLDRARLRPTTCDRARF